MSYLNKNFYRGNWIKHNVPIRVEEIVGGISSHKLDSDIQSFHFLCVWLLPWESILSERVLLQLPQSIVLFALIAQWVSNNSFLGSKCESNRIKCLVSILERNTSDIVEGAKGFTNIQQPYSLMLMLLLHYFSNIELRYK